MGHEAPKSAVKTKKIVQNFEPFHDLQALINGTHDAWSNDCEVTVFNLR